MIGVQEIEAALPDDWITQLGDALPDSHVRARLVGPDDAPVVVALGGISASRSITDTDHGSGWWNQVACAGGGIDTDRFRVFGMDYVPLECDRPIRISPTDHALLLALALDAAGISSLFALVGASYGGMVGQVFARLFPGRLDRLIVISAAHRPHPAATALRGVQRRIIQFAEDCGHTKQGVALARELAMIGYRTPNEFVMRFEPGLEEDGLSDACRYLVARGAAFAESMSAARYLSLSAAIDRHDERPERIDVQTVAIAVRNDHIVPLTDMVGFCGRLGDNCCLIEIDALTGHDAFLTETDTMNELLSTSLSGGDHDE